MRHDVDGLVVQVEERVEAALPVGRRAVVAQHVLVELQVRRDLGALDEGRPRGPARSRRPAEAPRRRRLSVVLAAVRRWRRRRRSRPVGRLFPPQAVLHDEEEASGELGGGLATLRLRGLRSLSRFCCTCRDR